MGFNHSGSRWELRRSVWRNRFLLEDKTFDSDEKNNHILPPLPVIPNQSMDPTLLKSIPGRRQSEWNTSSVTDLYSHIQVTAVMLCYRSFLTFHSTEQQRASICYHLFSGGHYHHILPLTLTFTLCRLQAITEYKDDRTRIKRYQFSATRSTHDPQCVPCTWHDLPTASNQAITKQKTGFCGSARTPNLPLRSAILQHVARKHLASRWQKSASNATAHDHAQRRFRILLWWYIKKISSVDHEVFRHHPQQWILIFLTRTSDSSKADQNCTRIIPQTITDEQTGNFQHTKCAPTTWPPSQTVWIHASTKLQIGFYIGEKLLFDDLHLAATLILDLRRYTWRRDVQNAVAELWSGGEIKFCNYVRVSLDFHWGWYKFYVFERGIFASSFLPSLETCDVLFVWSIFFSICLCHEYLLLFCCTMFYLTDHECECDG